MTQKNHVGRSWHKKNRPAGHDPKTKPAFMTQTPRRPIITQKNQASRS
jgi:hypothetical protein